MEIRILDLGSGNLNSLERCLKRLRIGTTQIIKVEDNIDKADIDKADILFLPGVGNFSHASKKIHDSDLSSRLSDFVKNRNRKLIGICLGAQLLLEASEEAPGSPGLSLISGKSSFLGKNDNYTGLLPRIGWDQIHVIDTKK